MSRTNTEPTLLQNAPDVGSSVPEKQHGTQFLGAEKVSTSGTIGKQSKRRVAATSGRAAHQGPDGLRERLQTERTRRIWANATCRSTACKAAPLTLMSSSKSLRARARRRETGTVLTQFSQRCVVCFRSKSRLVLTPRESGTGLLRTGAQEGVTRPP